MKLANLSLLIVQLMTPAALAGELIVTSVEPSLNMLNAPLDSAIVVHFDQAVQRGSITAASFWAFGRWSGTVSGSFSFSDGDQTVTLTPDQPFSAGETVMVILSHDILAAGGASLRSAGFCFQFWTESLAATLQFDEIDTLSTRTIPSQTTRSYGGVASDLNGDRYLDLAIINEDSADVRVFLNLADGSGLFDDFLVPPSSVNFQASPNEPADFNRDGNVDLCVANISTSSVSILLGNGDGTFQPQQEITVGSGPRGIAVVDADGDGDLDIANTNSNSGNISLLFNDGNGVFGAPQFYEGGGAGEWALGAADMNNDGILDLVIGTSDSQEILVNLGNGDGTFTPTSNAPALGRSWMLVLGDVNGDGNVDVSTANSTSNNGAILLGDGNGSLMGGTSYGTDPFPLATDLGDLDGDGDLDWILASFNGDWRLFTNDGQGVFQFLQEFPAPDAASCSLMMDFDNDGDLDLALIDELEDVVILMQQQGPIVPEFVRGDCNQDDMVDIADSIFTFNYLFVQGSREPGCDDACDMNDDGDVDIADG
ncbi:MAG: FG-GAP-like repeat-containing protein, partial [Planctomycetota bacterium]